MPNNNEFLDRLNDVKSMINNLDLTMFRNGVEKELFKLVEKELTEFNNEVLDCIDNIQKYYPEHQKVLEELSKKNNIGLFFYEYEQFLDSSQDPYMGLSRFTDSFKKLKDVYYSKVKNLVEKSLKEIDFSQTQKIKDKLSELENENELLSRKIAETDILKTEQIRNKLNELENQSELLNRKIAETDVLKNSLEHQLNEQKERYESVNTKLELEKQEDIYGKIANNYNKNARWWLFGIVTSIGFLVSLIFYIKENFCFDISCYGNIELSTYNTICSDCGEHILWLEIFKSIFFRILIISLNIYLITFCVKNYNASMHNKTINELRQNSFASALHFYNTTTGDKKDEILLKAADSIFSHRATGYQGKNSEPQNSFIQNIIDKVTPSK
ncbi:hypothetical protein DVK85_08185 [Flavobacterium arcticum]|uniref:Uncharacterized protein n=1 Tax=Flavobacterium arcticum TaxID=1784713 RepID=A0A345HCA9_9FLAO|nr:hypothetical protein [Flavobacterium arcticum]AXG74219.1 hypothetical protein DVK85_08185 [Flavobacterium arcticum]KAF2508194.1 hypothetical protein E0W72_11115 [Flavobacterium arcticum]